MVIWYGWISVQLWLSSLLAHLVMFSTCEIQSKQMAAGSIQNYIRVTNGVDLFTRAKNEWECSGVRQHLPTHAHECFQLKLSGLREAIVWQTGIADAHLKTIPVIDRIANLLYGFAVYTSKTDALFSSSWCQCKMKLYCRHTDKENSSSAAYKVLWRMTDFKMSSFRFCTFDRRPTGH